MGSNIVAISIDKVQNFLFSVIQGETAEQQGNKGTLSGVIQSSEFVSKTFFKELGIKEEKMEETVEGVFGGCKQEIILKCSGMCMFSIDLCKEEIIKRLDELFKEYYKRFRGQLLLKYTCFQKDISDPEEKLEAIFLGKKYLKKKDCMNEIISRNHKVLFQLQKSTPENDSFGGDAEKYPQFTDSLDKLYLDKNTETAPHNFRIAVIKADLDGMGDLFNGIQDYEIYNQVSNILYKYISLDSLYEETMEMKEKNKDFMLYPLYIAGDDIFFAVPVSQIIWGVNICKNILDKINNKLSKNSQNGSKISLSMSIGIEFTYNREPIRYYFERVQEQMECAKRAKEPEKGVVQLKIAVDNYVFYKFVEDKIDKNSNKEKNKDKNKNRNKKSNEDKNVPQWKHFLNTVKNLKTMRYELKEMNGDSYELHHFFYSFLERITDSDIQKNEIKYSNIFLYHVLPKYLGSSNQTLREAELFVLDAIVRQALVRKDTPEGERELSFCKPEKRKIETYIRLLLLFSDNRFEIEKNNNEKTSNKRKISEVKGPLFNQTMRYLYNKSLLVNPEKLRDIFVKEANFILINEKDENNEVSYKFIHEDDYQGDEEYKKEHQVKAYQTLPLSSSMLFKMKKIQAKCLEMSSDIERSSEMITTVNPPIKMDKQASENSDVNHSPYLLNFDREQFEETAPGLWTNDYIDSLLIFYKLKDLAIKYKAHYTSHKNSLQKKNKSHTKNQSSKKQCKDSKKIKS
jgi:hypothetical protein